MFKESFINNKKVFISDLIPDLTHFFTTRESFLKTKDEYLEEQVRLNKIDVCNYLKISQDNLVSAKQIHSANIQIASAEINSYPDTDAIILTNKEQSACLNFADCTPVIIYDKENNIAAVIHAGWRGTAQSIAQKTGLKMQKEFNSKPQNLSAVIGPAISMCCYNVGDEVYTKLKETVSDFSGLYNINDNNIYIDLKGINKKQLNDIGINNIDICPFCTCCNNDMFFSYRKENGTSNRHNAVIKLK